MRPAGWFAAALLLAQPAAAHAQAQPLRGQCAVASREAVRVFCENVADATAIIQPRLGIALTGGNPVPGTASTLGMRLGSLPRFTLGLRVTAARVDLPPVERLASSADVDFPLGAISADASVGLYQGFALVPTVGGFGSVDILGSIGVIPLPSGEGFDDRAPFSWSLGARLGILRESFTAPGVSVSGMYRSVGGVTYGSTALTDTDAFIDLSEIGMWSVRGVVGKRALGFGLTGGLGWDRYTANVAGIVRDPEVLAPDQVIQLAQSGMATTRLSAFANASFTFIILNLVTEIGWQGGGKAPADGSGKLERGALFGGLALRLAI
jgi:hypothetical protein